MTEKELTSELEVNPLSKEMDYRTLEELKYLLSSSPAVLYTCRPPEDFPATFISQNIVSQLGYEPSEFIEAPGFWADRIHPEDRPRVFAGLPELFEKGYHTHEYRFLHKDGSYRWVHDQLKLIRDPAGNPIEIVGFWMDITDRKRIEEALRESEDKYRTIFETTGTATAIIDEDTTILLANEEFEKLCGYSKEEIEGKKSWTEFVRQEDLERMKEYHRLRRIDPNAAPRNYESRFIDKQGNIRNIFITVAMIPRTNKSVASILDITEIKRTEEALRKSEEKLHFLSSHLLTAQETERKRISMELHDELGQALIALRLHLNSIQKLLRKDQKALRNECEYVKGTIEQIIENVRRLSKDLSPYLLENLGLTAALRRLIDDLIGDYKIEASIDMAEIDHVLSQKSQLMIYRIFQEALTNIRRHAQATRISIVIQKENDHLSFWVEDDGIGFEVKQVMMRDVDERGLGLAAMEERVRMLGGLLDVRSEIGKGTRISFAIPASKEGI